MERKSVHVSITGRVQGVGYRAWCHREADRRGLAGWVRNRSTGEVEAVLSGPADRVDDMIAACRQGPTGARVTAVTVLGPAGEVIGPFDVLATR